jgi:hypothetical protein
MGVGDGSSVSTSPGPAVAVGEAVGPADAGADAGGIEALGVGDGAAHAASAMDASTQESRDPSRRIGAFSPNRPPLRAASDRVG